MAERVLMKAEREWVRDEKKKYRFLPLYDPAHGSKASTGHRRVAEPAGRPVGVAEDGGRRADGR